MLERAERVTVRFSPLLLGRLDDLAAARGCSRSAVLRQLVADAALSPADAVPDEAELLAVAAERARAGNMAAVRLLLDRAAAEPSTEFEKLLGVRLARGDRQ
ncbi:MAG: ribbon-helix-helix protein, CopG family [Actinomycetota bacterium]|nr:ribbon-helix-helix protein, CopG family [Actinomycetota bacterium]